MPALEGIALDNQIQRTIDRYGREDAVASFGEEAVSRIEQEQDELFI